MAKPTYVMSAKVREVKDDGFPGRDGQAGIVRKKIRMLVDDGKNLCVMSEFHLYPNNGVQKNITEGSLSYEEVTEALVGKTCAVAFEVGDKGARAFWVQHGTNYAKAVGQQA